MNLQAADHRVTVLPWEKLGFLRMKVSSFLRHKVTLPSAQEYGLPM